LYKPAGSIVAASEFEPKTIFILRCQNDKTLHSQWRLLQTINKPLPALAQGKNEIKFDGKYSGENDSKIKIEILAKGIAETMHY
jgi:hypothetical protein